MADILDAQPPAGAQNAGWRHADKVPVGAGWRRNRAPHNIQARSVDPRSQAANQQADSAASKQMLHKIEAALGDWYSYGRADKADTAIEMLAQLAGIQVVNDDGAVVLVEAGNASEIAEPARAQHDASAQTEHDDVARLSDKAEASNEFEARDAGDRLQSFIADPQAWIGQPRHFTATREEAIRREVLSQLDPEILAAGGLDAVEDDPWHQLHDIYDDLGPVRRDYETIVQRCRGELGEAHFMFDPEWGVELSPEGDAAVNRHVKEIRENQPVLHHLDDPNYRWDDPDEIGVDGYTSTQAQAIRRAVLEMLAPDVAGAGGFPGVDRDPNHRRHCSPEGLKRLRWDYDAIVERADAEIVSARGAFVQHEEFGWMLSGPAQDVLEDIVGQFEVEAQRNRGHGLSL